MALFEFETYNRFLNNNDYNGAADYASKSFFKDKKQQAKMLDNIKILRNKGRVYNGMMNNANEDQKQALAFKTAMDSGTPLDLKNKYYKQYVDAVNNLFGTNATSVAVEFDAAKTKRYGRIPIVSEVMDNIGVGGNIDWLAKDEDYGFDGFQQFLSNMGYSDDAKGKAAFSKLGFKQETINGRTRLTIEKSNPNFYKAMIALRNVDTNHVPGSGNKVIQEGIRGEKRFKLAGVDRNGKLIQLDNGNQNATEASSMAYAKNNYLMWRSGLSDQSMVVNDRGMSDDYFVNPDYAPIIKGVGLQTVVDKSNIAGQFGAIEDVLRRTNNIKQELTAKEEERTKDLVMSTTVSGSLGAGMAKLESDFSRGLVDAQSYNVYKKQIEEHYENLLSGADLSQYNVYATNEDGTVLKQYDTKDKNVLNDIIAGAIGNNRLKFSAAIMGNKSGTMITVLPKTDNNGNAVTQKTNIFVEDLFQGSVEESLNRDTKMRALKELNGMEYYGYRYTIPALGDSEGGELGIDVGANEAYLLHKDGTKTFVSKAKAQDMINRAEILSDFIDSANQTFFNEDGKFVKNKNINAEVSNWANAATLELYNATAERAKMLSAQGLDNKLELEYLTNKKSLIKNYILDAIGYFDTNK
uniref:Internal virion protein n=1 Tax=Geladintestivirus 4 TaxID=3233136 RepID=A0AAU8MIY4_9CAUD